MIHVRLLIVEEEFAKWRQFVYICNGADRRVVPSSAQKGNAHVTLAINAAHQCYQSKVHLNDVPAFFIILNELLISAAVFQHVEQRARDFRRQLHMRRISKRIF